MTLTGIKARLEEIRSGQYIGKAAPALAECLLEIIGRLNARGGLDEVRWSDVLKAGVPPRPSSPL
jgi:hypothetical protein